LNAATTKTLAAIAFGAALAMSGAARAEGSIQILTKDHEGIVAAGVEWKPAPTIPPGAKMVMLYGDPSKPGPYLFRVQFPAGYKLPPHKHEDQRWVTVLKGSYWSAAGATFEQGQLKRYGPRDTYTTQPGVTHFAWAETDVVIQEMGMGPVSGAIEYANPVDDPRKK
jgi:quercetin dioxygenase-like cupin family protein